MAQTLVILDYGSQYTQLITRKSREIGVYSVILSYHSTLEQIQAYNPLGIILSGGPNSVYDKDAPGLPEGILELRVPVLGICYGMQLLAQNLGGTVTPSKKREYGEAAVTLTAESIIIPKNANNTQVWMSHGDHVSTPPTGFVVTAKSGTTICAIENTKQNLFGLQFHPEVAHSQHGKSILKQFLGLCNFDFSWQAASVLESQIQTIKETVSDKQVICALSGGVDSSVAATLVNRAIGDQQTCVFVDTGLLRKDEYEEVLAAYHDIGLNVQPVRAAEQFYTALAGVSDPEQKRKIIGGLFIDIFESEAAKVKNTAFLVQGTLYPDIIESVSVNGPSVTIKSHHNVGGLPEKMKLKLIEPLRELFKDEVRELGAALGLPANIVQRQPFPGPGLAIRILGAVSPESVIILQEADAIVRTEIDSHPIRPDVWQFFAVLLPIKAVGVMGDGRTYEQVVAIRAVSSSDGMTADWSRLPHDLLAQMSNRIIGEVRGVNRVVYDITSKPPGTIEWE